MSESESTQIWDEEGNLEAQDNAAFGDALASLEEQLQQHDDQELYDEEEQEIVMAEEGLSHAPELSESDEPETVSYAEALDSHEAEASETDSDDVSSEAAVFEDYPSFDEGEEEALYAEDAGESAEASPTSGNGMGSESGTDDFNLATLTQLVDEIRHESQRVSEMKASVAKALNLIQEMSESLKS
ncbi:MAG: hypothetical protein IGS03_02615 [Candidatus Sericytochromatia bacterium]|nr:hypothetical protein [Candidatus Sericytochromatia bacterium]